MISILSHQIAIKMIKLPMNGLKLKPNFASWQYRWTNIFLSRILINLIVTSYFTLQTGSGIYCAHRFRYNEIRTHCRSFCPREIWHHLPYGIITNVNHGRHALERFYSENAYRNLRSSYLVFVFK